MADIACMALCCLGAIFFDKPNCNFCVLLLLYSWVHWFFDFSSYDSKHK